jgi:putative membrane protein
MISAALLSALHVLALGIGLPGIVLRARALSRSGDGGPDVAGALAADNAWGIAALLRAFGGLEKGTAFYLSSPMFVVKMALFGLILLLEVWPMITLVRWRIWQARGQALDLSPARMMGTLSWIEVGLLLLMPFAAAMMARGIVPG